jgi:osmotically-inducible protein OsmY
MSDLQRMITRDLEDDVTLNAKDINVDIVAQGFLKKQRFIRLFGSVRSEVEKRKAEQIAAHHAGDVYRVLNELAIKQPAL